MLHFLLMILIIAIMLYIPLLNNILSYPRLTTVKKSERDLLKPDERYIYDYIITQGYYVSCNVNINSGIVRLPMALIPFRTAIITNETHKLKYWLIKLYLELQGWSVCYLKLSPDENHTELSTLKSFLEKQCEYYGNRTFGKVE